MQQDSNTGELNKTSSVDELIYSVKLEADLGLRVDQLQAMSDLDKVSYKDLWQSQQMISISGVMAGVKPAAIIDYDDQLLGFIDKLGLECTGTYPGDVVAISRSKDLANRVFGLFDEVGCQVDRTDENRHRIAGKALGYPETATEYFLKRSPTISQPTEQQLPMIEPLELEGTVRRHFHQFVLSDEHWREELNDYVIPLEEATRNLAPLTYRQLERLTRRENVSNALGRLLGRQPASRFDSSVAVSRVR